MTKFLKKPVTYLIVTMLAVPNSLFSGIMSPVHAKAAEKQVVINEVLPNPKVECREWVELYNPGAEDINLDGWYLKDATATHIKDFTETDVIKSGGFLVVETAGTVLNNDTDSVQLYADSASITPEDEISYNKHAGFESGRSLGRLSDGSTQWIIFSNPSRGQSNHVATIVPQSGELSAGQGQSISFEIEVQPNANYEKAFAVALESNQAFRFSDIFQSITVADGTTSTSLDIEGSTITFPTEGLALQYGKNIKYAVTATLKETELSRVFNFSVSLLDNLKSELSNTANYKLTLKDTTAPVVTLNGDKELTIKMGEPYTELGATVKDNVDQELAATISGSVDASKEGDYVLTYSATDLSGNVSVPVTRLVHVVAPLVLGEPQFTVSSRSQNGQNSVTIEWEGVGGGIDGYDIFVDGTWIFEKAQSENDASTHYVKNVNINKYGTIGVLVIAKKGTTKSLNNVYKAVVFKEPVKTVQEESKPVETKTVAPSKAKAAAPQVAEAPKQEEQKATSDDNGKIKSEESSDEEAEKVNWTPWIVLFILIILAGAATGGYFYWFSGEDEVQAVVRVPKNTTKKETKAVAKKTNKTAKKTKRW